MPTLDPNAPPSGPLADRVRWLVREAARLEASPAPVVATPTLSVLLGASAEHASPHRESPFAAPTHEICLGDPVRPAIPGELSRMHFRPLHVAATAASLSPARVRVLLLVLEDPYRGVPVWVLSRIVERSDAWCIVQAEALVAWRLARLSRPRTEPVDRTVTLKDEGIAVARHIAALRSRRHD